MKLPFTNKLLVVYLLKFIGAFCVLYFGTLAVEGLAAPEGKHYSPFIDQHLDYVSWLRSSLMHAAKSVVAGVGYKAELVSPTLLQVVNGRGVNVGYSCLGYGVTSFWLAFVFANTGSWKRKARWMFFGALLLWMINVLRISLVLIAANKNWQFAFGWDHHTWFTIVAYGAIFLMIWVYDKKVFQVSKK